MFISILSIIIIISIVFILFKLTHVIWKTILFSILIILLITGITGYMIYKDVQNTINEEKIIIVSYEDEVLTGLTFSENLDDKKYLTTNQLNEYSTFLSEEDLKQILSDNYLLINFNIVKINNTNGVEYMNNSFTKDEVFEMMLAENPTEFIQSASKLSEEISLNEIITEEEMIEYKMGISGLLFKELLMSDQNTLKQIEIYPERITIKIIKELPFIFDSIKNKIKEVN